MHRRYVKAEVLASANIPPDSMRRLVLCLWLLQLHADDLHPSAKCRSSTQSFVWADIHRKLRAWPVGRVSAYNVDLVSCRILADVHRDPYRPTTLGRPSAVCKTLTLPCTSLAFWQILLTNLVCDMLSTLFASSLQHYLGLCTGTCVLSLIRIIRTFPGALYWNVPAAKCARPCRFACGCSRCGRSRRGHPA